MAQERQVRLLLLKPADFASQVKTDDAALKAFYDANAKRFRTAESVKLDYVCCRRRLWLLVCRDGCRGQAILRAAQGGSGR
jgi:hypothetical protein